MGGRSSWSSIFSAVHLTAVTGFSSETEKILSFGAFNMKYFLSSSLSLYKMRQDGQKCSNHKEI